MAKVSGTKELWVKYQIQTTYLVGCEREGQAQVPRSLFAFNSYFIGRVKRSGGFGVENAARIGRGKKDFLWELAYLPHRHHAGILRLQLTMTPQKEVTSI